METKKTTAYTNSQIIRVFVSVLAFSFALTILFFIMRSVLAIGGFCAEGGPYQIAIHCPKGIVPLAAFSPLLMIASIFVYLTVAGVSGVFLMWSGIFISLGWNFMEFGLYPIGKQSPVIVWVISGVVFLLMGIGPLLHILRSFKGRIVANVVIPPRKVPAPRIIVLNLVTIILGIILGIYIFNLVTT